MATARSTDDENGPFMPIRPELQAAEPGFDGAADRVEDDGSLRRSPSDVSEPFRPLAERLREAGAGG